MSEQFSVASINATTHTISLVTNYGTALTSLSPTITVSADATIAPTSGTARNFTSAVTYTVTAQDAIEQIWTVTVTTKPTPQLFMLNGKMVKLNGKYKIPRQ